MDSGVDSFSDHLGDLPNIAISLCGGLTENREITRGNQEFLLCVLASSVLFRTSSFLLHQPSEKGSCQGEHTPVFLPTEEFQERAISYQEFADNPSIIDDPNLVVKIGTK